MPFVHLHVHTHYSLGDGICRIPELTAAAAGAGMPALAITDLGVLYGLIEFYQAADAQGIQPILGCEIELSEPLPAPENTSEPGVRHARLVLLAENLAGYHNLLRLVSEAHLQGTGRIPRVGRELLARHAHGCLALSAGIEGEAGWLARAGQAAAARRAVAEMQAVFGKDGFFLELQDHGLAEEQQANRGLIAVARGTGARLVASNHVHYVAAQQAMAQEVLACIQTQQSLRSAQRVRLPNAEYYLKSGDEMARLFAAVPDALANTEHIAERCHVALPLGELHFPRFPLPGGQEARACLAALSREGLNQRYGIADSEHPRNAEEREIVSRLQHELEVVEKTRFVNYFLVVADFVKYARQCDIPVGPGRGSCAGSLLAYVLGITGVDPLKYGLIFERFLNPERVSPPDFDIDFCQKRRGEVIEYLRQRYGPDQVAHIVTFATFGARTAIRDVGRVLEIPGAECERLVKMVIEAEEGLHTPLPRILERHPALRRDYTTAGSAAQRILTQALLLEGLNRNAGTHAAGVVIGPGPLVEWTPLTRDREGHVLTQYAMESVRAVGLLKIDLLGLKTLTVLQNAAHLIARQRGAPLILDALPLDDKPTYALLTRGDTTGIFQVESEGMRDLIRRVGVDSITELMALIALYRPGPMSMLEEFIRRKTGQAPATFEHPALKPVLSETHGVMIYQEQVLLAAQALAGYTLGEADLLRYAMTKKNAALMAAQQARFAAGCMRHHRIAAPEAQRLFEVLARFAAYGFNKSHSAAYALMTYQTAFLKANYPVEFMAAVLTGEMGNFGRLPTLVRATEAMEIEVLPPDVNQSATAFLPAGSAIRFGLAGVKNVGELSASQIAAERERQGPYRDPLDFCVRLEGSAVNRRVVESLIRCGALDTLGYHRARVWRSLEGLWTRAGEIARERRSGQRRLFEWAAPVADLLPDCEPWPQSRMLADEKELLGIYRNGHPLRTYAWLLEHYRLTTVHQLQSLPEGAPIYLGGLIVAVERRRSAADSAPFAEVQVEDLDGTADVLAPPDVFRRYAALLAPDSAILLCGVVSHAVGTHVILNEAHPLTTAAQRLAARVSLHLSAAEMGNEVLDRVRDLLRQHPGPTPVTLRIEFPNSEKVLIEMGGDFRVTADEALFHAFEHVLGEGAVYIEVKHPACAPTDAPHSSTNESGD